MRPFSQRSSAYRWSPGTGIADANPSHAHNACIPTSNGRSHDQIGRVRRPKAKDLIMHFLSARAQRDCPSVCGRPRVVHCVPDAPIVWTAASARPLRHEGLSSSAASRALTIATGESPPALSRPAQGVRSSTSLPWTARLLRRWNASLTSSSDSTESIRTLIEPSASARSARSTPSRCSSRRSCSPA